MKTTDELEDQISNEEQAIAQCSDEKERFIQERAEALADGAYEDAERLEKEIARVRADARRRRERVALLEEKWEAAKSHEEEQTLDTERAKAERAAQVQRELMQQYRAQARPLAETMRKLAAIDTYISKVNEKLSDNRIASRDAELRGKPAESVPDRVEKTEQWQHNDGSRVHTFRQDEQGRLVPIGADARLVEVEHLVPGTRTPAVVPKPLYETVRLPGYSWDEPELWDEATTRDAIRRMSAILAELMPDDTREVA